MTGRGGRKERVWKVGREKNGGERGLGRLNK